MSGLIWVQTVHKAKDKIHHWQAKSISVTSEETANFELSKRHLNLADLSANKSYVPISKALAYKTVILFLTISQNICLGYTNFFLSA